MKAFLDISVPILTFFIMIIVGLDLRPGDLNSVHRQKRLMALGLLAPMIVLPATTLALVKGMRLHADLAAGIILIAACPAGALSNVYTLLARGNVAISVILTALANLAGVVSIPAILWIVSSTLDVPTIRPPVIPMISQLILLLVVPVAIGILIRRNTGPSPAATRLLRRIGVIAVAALVLIVFAAYASASLAAFPAIATLACITTTLWFATGYGLAWALRTDARSRLAVGFQLPVRNVGIAIVIAVTQLGRIDFAFTAACFLIVQLPMMLAAAWAFAGQREEGHTPPGVPIPPIRPEYSDPA